MAEADSIESIVFNGKFPHGVDGSRRVMVPAKWLPEKKGDKASTIEFTLIVWPKSSSGVCLRALPPHKMAELMREINAMPNSDPNKVVLKRFIGSESTQVPVDKQGRICLPEEMAAAAAIKDKAVLVGLLDRFEIWSPERGAAVKAADAVMAAEAFKLME